MSKPVLALFCLLAGCTAGILLGYALFKEPSPDPPKNEPTHYYYLLNDSTVSRHTIEHTGNTVIHTVDTIRVQAK